MLVTWNAKFYSQTHSNNSPTVSDVLLECVWLFCGVGAWWAKIRSSLFQTVAEGHCVERVRIRSYSGPYFPALRLNSEGYSVSLSCQSECGKIRTRITPNTDTFHAIGGFFWKSVSSTALCTYTWWSTRTVLVVALKVAKSNANKENRNATIKKFNRSSNN